MLALLSLVCTGVALNNNKTIIFRYSIQSPARRYLMWKDSSFVSTAKTEGSYIPSSRMVSALATELLQSATDTPATVSLLHWWIRGNLGQASLMRVAQHTAPAQRQCGLILAWRRRGLCSLTEPRRTTSTAPPLPERKEKGYWTRLSHQRQFIEAAGKEFGVKTVLIQFLFNSPHFVPAFRLV